MLAWIFSKVIAWASNGVLEKVLSMVTAGQNAATERDKLKTQIVVEGIEAELAARANAREIRLATAGFPEMRLLTFAIATPFVVHLWLVAVDTWFEFDWWTVEKFPPPFDEWEGLILLSFFGVYAGLGAVQSIAAAVGRKLK